MMITSEKLTLKIAEQILMDLDTPISLSIYILMQDGSDSSWDQVFKYQFNPLNYTEAAVDLARRDLCAVSLLSKVPNFRNLPLEEVALEKFGDGEALCRSTNERICRNWHDPDFESVRSALLKILGNCPSMSYCFSASDFGKGASVCLRADEASADLKACMGDTVTYDCATALSQCDWPADMQPRALRLIPGNVVTTTPKNATTDRTIAIEAAVNSRCQKGLGDDIRQKLRRIGINLNDQSFNQWLAENALRLKRATLDLKNASGTIASMLVFRLLHDTDWIDRLTSCRSARYTLGSRNDILSGKAEWVEYESWSSMGNGYTFELESAIFAAICIAAGVDLDQLSVYGDDIIVPQCKVEAVTALLRKCGFCINETKSFWSGLFFESCGVFSFSGEDVTPVKIKDYVHDLPHALVLANKLRSFAALGQHDALDRRVLPSYRMCVDACRDNCFMFLQRQDAKQAKRKSRPLTSKRQLNKKAAALLQSLRGPSSVEGCLHSHIAEAAPTYSRKRGGLRFSVVEYVTRPVEFDGESLYYRRESRIGGYLQLPKPVGLSRDSWLGADYREPPLPSGGNTVKLMVTKKTRFCQTSTERWDNALRW